MTIDEHENVVKLLDLLLKQKDIEIKERKIPDQEPMMERVKELERENIMLKAENTNLRGIIAQQREPDRAWKKLSTISEILDDAQPGEIDTARMRGLECVMGELAAISEILDNDGEG